MKAALFWETLDTGIKCMLCPRGCVIGEGKTGFCGVRKNVGDKLYSMNYGRVASASIDPIEKKPLFHFAPGSRCLSIATVGCNLGCRYCQNWEISQSKEITGEALTPKQIVETAKSNGVPGIAYTYVEPTIFYEFALETMKLAKKASLYNVWVSNGYTSSDAIRMAAPYMDAINVDYKGDANFYRKLCAVPDMEPIKEAMRLYKKNKVWIEITNLIIPGWNDKPEQIIEMCNWIVSNLGTETPLHISKFFPNYKMTDVKPTEEKTLNMAFDIAKKAGLEYVYIGNVRNPRESTYCPKCGTVTIERKGYELGKICRVCSECGYIIPIKPDHYPYKKKDLK